MTFQWMMPIWLAVIVLLPLLVACVLGVVLRRRQRGAWVRRTLMVLLIIAVAMRPSTPLEGEQTQRMNASVFFVVDRTGSMRAEDYAGGKPRLDGVKHDMEKILSRTKGARYSIIGFDSTATAQLPLTTDAGAARAWIDTLDTELTSNSQGSNVDRPLTALTRALNDARKDAPEDTIIVYVLTDGENTDGRRSASFAPAASFVDAGGVLGYGTSQGGRMKAHGGKDDGKYITEGGTAGVSKIDEGQLRTIAQQLKVPYLHRTAPDAAQDDALAATLKDVHLKAVPTKRASQVASFRDWYWIPAIALALLFVWEVGALTFRLPRGRAVARPAGGSR